MIKFSLVLISLFISLQGEDNNIGIELDNKTLTFFKTVKKTNFIINNESIGNISSIGFSENSLLVSDLNFIIKFDSIGNQLNRFGRDQYTPFTFCHEFKVLRNGKIVLNDLIRGIFHLLVYTRSGNLIIKKRHDPDIRKIVEDKNGYILVGGLHMIGYNEMLVEYDEDTFFPSKRSRQGIKQYFDNAIGYWIVKYDSNLNTIDSLLLTSGDMRDKFNAAMNAMFSFDIDHDNTIWAFGYPDNKIKHYSENGEFIYEFDLEPEDINMPPSGLTDKQWSKLKRMKKPFYWAFNLVVIQDKILISYKKQYPDREAKTHVFAVYTKEGQFIKRDIIPHYFFKEGDALYFWHKENSKRYLIKCEL